MERGTHGRRLLVWDAPNMDMCLSEVIGERASASTRPDLDAVLRWMRQRAQPGDQLEACVFINVPPGFEAAMGAWVVGLRHSGYAVFAKPKRSHRDDVDPDIVGHLERRFARGSLVELVVASHDAKAFAGPLRRYAKAGVAVMVLGYREKDTFAATSPELIFVDLEDLDGVFERPLPRTNLFDLPPGGRWFEPFTRPEAEPRPSSERRSGAGRARPGVEGRSGGGTGEPGAEAAGGPGGPGGPGGRDEPDEPDEPHERAAGDAGGAGHADPAGTPPAPTSTAPGTGGDPAEGGSTGGAGAADREDVPDEGPGPEEPPSADEVITLLAAEVEVAVEAGGGLTLRQAGDLLRRRFPDHGLATLGFASFTELVDALLERTSFVLVRRPGASSVITRATLPGPPTTSARTDPAAGPVPRPLGGGASLTLVSGTEPPARQPPLNPIYQAFGRSGPVARGGG